MLKRSLLLNMIMMMMLSVLTPEGGATGGLLWVVQHTGVPGGVAGHDDDTQQYIYRVFFFHWYPIKKVKYGKPRLGESTLT